MIKQYEITPSKTYASKKNAEKAVEKMLEKNPGLENMGLVYTVNWTEEGRCFVMFHGASAILAGIPHLGFNCVANS